MSVRSNDRQCPSTPVELLSLTLTKVDQMYRVSRYSGSRGVNAQSYNDLACRIQTPENDSFLRLYRREESVE